MAVPSLMTDLSTSEASNSPADSDSITATTRPSDYLRAHAAILRTLAAGDTIAAGATVNLSTKANTFITLTGAATTISALGTVAAGVYKWVIYNAAHTVTHNATSLILLGAANRTVAAGDASLFVSEGSGNWRELSFGDATGYQPLDTTLTALAGVLTAANKIPYATALNTAGELDFKDEDNMASNSATALPSQQSVKAYVDTSIAGVNGNAVQIVYSSTTAVATGATTMPYDDTIPQNTEGNEYLTASITPTSATNKLLIEALCHLAGDTSGNQSIALFQDATAGALAAGSADSGAVNVQEQVLLTHYMTAGTTSATTFKIRGGSSAGTQTLNGEGGARMFGGVYTSWLRITEIKQ